MDPNIPSQRCVCRDGGTAALAGAVIINQVNTWESQRRKMHIPDTAREHPHGQARGWQWSPTKDHPKPSSLKLWGAFRTVPAGAAGVGEGSVLMLEQLHCPWR